jgi:hypothetical protein
MASVSAALALSNVEVVPTGARAGETRLNLLDSGGKPVTPDAGNPNRYSNIPSGRYATEVVVGGKPVGSRSSVNLDDGNNRLRVDSVTGAVEVIRQIVFLQQQQQSAWGFGLYGGWKRMPYDGEFSRASPPNGGSTDLDTDGWLLALEARYYWRRQQQTLGAQLFLYGTYVEYFGTDEQRRFLDIHPTPGNDSGLGIKEKRSVLYGLGGRWNLAQQVGFELMLGGHTTWVRGEGFSDESCCGSTDVRFSRDKTLWGPMVAVGLTYPLFKLASGRPVTGFARWTALHMDDFEATGRSPAFGFDYRARFNGGWNNSLVVGAQF